MTSTKCIDPQFEYLIIRDVAATALQGKEVALSPESQKHLEACDSCRERLPIWISKGKVGHEYNQYEQLAKRAAAGDSTILRRAVHGGLALFKPYDQQENRGIVLIVDPEQHFMIRSIQGEMSIEEFEAL